MPRITRRLTACQGQGATWCNAIKVKGVQRNAVRLITGGNKNVNKEIIGTKRQLAAKVAIISNFSCLKKQKTCL